MTDPVDNKATGNVISRFSRPSKSGKTYVTVIWNDLFCDGDGAISTELDLELTPAEVRDTPTNTLMRRAMLYYYGENHTADEAVMLTDEAMKNCGFVGIIIGPVEWLPYR